MRNAEQIRKRLDEVKKMKSYTEALNTLADIQYEIGMDACHERRELRAEVERLRIIILGNGKPEGSLLNRVSDIEGCVSDFTDVSGGDIKEIKEALLGTFDKKGLVEQIRADKAELLEQTKADKVELLNRIKPLQELKDDVKKGKWVIYGIIIAEVIALIIRLL